MATNSEGRVRSDRTPHRQSQGVTKQLEDAFANQLVKDLELSSRSDRRFLIQNALGFGDLVRDPKHGELGRQTSGFLKRHEW